MCGTIVWASKTRNSTQQLAYKELEMLSTSIEDMHFSTIRTTVWALKFREALAQ